MGGPPQKYGAGSPKTAEVWNPAFPNFHAKFESSAVGFHESRVTSTWAHERPYLM